MALQALPPPMTSLPQATQSPAKQTTNSNAFLLKIQNHIDRETGKKNMILNTFWMIFIFYCCSNSWMVMSTTPKFMDGNCSFREASHSTLNT